VAALVDCTVHREVDPVVVSWRQVDNALKKGGRVKGRGMLAEEGVVLAA